MMTRKEMTKEEVIAIVEKHEMWITGDKRGERADFTDVIFPSNSNLREAKFTECCIKYSEFTAAYLKNAEFSDCVVLAVDLTRSVLTNINAEGTTFVNTDFEDADLRDVGFLDSICR